MVRTLAYSLGKMTNKAEVDALLDVYIATHTPTHPNASFVKVILPGDSIGGKGWSQVTSWLGRVYEDYTVPTPTPTPTPLPGPSPSPVPGPAPSPWDEGDTGGYDWDKGSAYVAEGPYSYTWGGGAIAADAWAPGTSAWDYPSMWYDKADTGGWNVTSAWSGFTSTGGWDSGGTWGAGSAGGGWLSRTWDWFVGLWS